MGALCTGWCVCVYACVRAFCQEGPGLTAVWWDAALAGITERCVKNASKIGNQGNWISSAHCICIESEAHAQIIITKIPIN